MFPHTTGTDATTDPYAGFGGGYGYYADAETGLSLLGHRYYDTGTGRFVTRDPIGYDGGINLYAYTQNNPINEGDPDGLDPYLVHPTNSNGTFSGGTPYLMDGPPFKNIGRIASSFGKRSKHTPAIIIFARENQTNQGNDFKKGCNASKPLYHLRSLGGNFLYGAESAAAGWSLQNTLGGGQDFRRAGSVEHGVNTLRDILSGNKKAVHNDFFHPPDEQQAIQDGFNWWKQHSGSYP